MPAKPSSDNAWLFEVNQVFSPSTFKSMPAEWEISALPRANK
jgi:hypothetical protein